MLNFFGISDEVFFDPYKVKIITGIAGSAKSSNCDRILKEHGTEYGRYTSTNKLKRDAEERYGGHVKTIAAGLFETDNGRFYASEKLPEYNTVVIDEVLQADPKVFEWVRHNAGKTNVILCTDEKQMLTPDAEIKMIEEFTRLKNDSASVYVNLKKTYRARTPETEAMYNLLYNLVESSENAYDIVKKRVNVIKYDDIEYTHNDVYICHTNEIERAFYEKFDIMHDYAAELIPKGHIASKRSYDPTKYPITPQENAKRCRSGYLQPAKIGTPTRYQGSEVTTGTKLYYIVEPGSRITNREIYTVVTRLYDINDLVIVEVEGLKRVYPLKRYDGKPVKKIVLYNADGTEKVSDGKALDEIMTPDENEVDESVLYKVVTEAEPEQGEVYSREAFLYNGKMITGKHDDDTPTQKNATTIQSLLKKEPEFDYRYMPDIIRAYEKAQKDKRPGAVVDYDVITGARIRNTHAGYIVVKKEGGLSVEEMARKIMGMEAPQEIKKKKDYRYQLDLKSAYPHILKYADLPINGDFLPPEPGNENGEKDNGRIRLFVCHGNPIAEWSCIWTGELLDYVKKYDKALYYQYLGSLPKKRGSKMGEYLFDRCNRSIEAKQKIKSIRYGYLERPYLKPMEFDGSGHAVLYGYDANANRQPLMISILSTLAKIMLTVRYEIYGNIYDGYVNVDALFFDYEGNITELSDRLKDAITPYNFRVIDNQTRETVYQTYEELKSESEIKRQKERNRRKK